MVLILRMDTGTIACPLDRRALVLALGCRTGMVQLFWDQLHARLRPHPCDRVAILCKSALVHDGGNSTTS